MGIGRHYYILCQFYQFVNNMCPTYMTDHNHKYDQRTCIDSPVHIGLQMGEPTTNCNIIDFFTICSRYVPHITYKKSN